MWKTFDSGFMWFLSLQYFNYGFKIIVSIAAQDLANNYYKI